ncbi:MAG: dephospho-CoA kinase [Bdellovibrionaceae bacterium]|jgi:dephospho-CoA kinase|nr:dephospho-CoA kinase [Pseudobdellovibrionaceae bacterium]
MIWVGLTGGIATGKSTVAKTLAKMGFTVLNADELVHRLLLKGSEAYTEVLDAFGLDILGPGQQVDRKKLGEIVFKDKSKLELLESIIHPKIRKCMKTKREDLTSKGEDIAFYDVPLLFEKKMETQFDQIVVVSCSEDLQVKRLMAREKLNKGQALSRIALQLPMKEKEKKANLVIMNNEGLLELEQKVRSIYAQ